MISRDKGSTLQRQKFNIIFFLMLDDVEIVSHKGTQAFQQQCNKKLFKRKTQKHAHIICVIFLKSHFNTNLLLVKIVKILRQRKFL
jgi:hypothetical protein